MIVAGAFNALIRPGLRRNFRDEYNAYEPEYPNFMNTGTMDSPEMSATIMTGLNRLYELGDGEPITYEIPKMGPTVAGVDKEFGVGVSISRRTLEDDQYGKMRNSARWLGHAARMTFEYRAAAFLDDAFTGNVFKAIDGQPWLSTAHTYLNASGVWANRPAQEVQLSVAGLTMLMDMFMQMRDHNGDPIRMAPNTLIIGNNATDYQTALAIFNSSLEPFTAENQDNALRRQMGTPKIVISRFMQNNRAYFLVDSRYNDVNFLMRRAPKLEDDYDFNTGATKAKVTTRFMIWGVDPRGWVGANPS